MEGEGEGEGEREREIERGWGGFSVMLADGMFRNLIFRC